MAQSKGTVYVEVKADIAWWSRIQFFLASLLSRKFLLAVAAVAKLLADKQYPEAIGVVLAFLGVEGAADAIERREQAKKDE